MNESYREAIRKKRVELREHERDFRWRLLQAPFVFGGMALYMYFHLTDLGWSQFNVVLGSLLFALFPIVVVGILWYRLSRRP
jgi:hypothetical protein